MNHPRILISPSTEFYQPEPAQVRHLPSADGQRHSPRIDITFAGHLSDQQIQSLAFALNDATGLFSCFTHLAYHISGRHHPLLLTTLSKNRPASAESYEIFYRSPQECVTIWVFAGCSSRQKRTQRTSISVPVDYDIRQLEADLDRGIFDTVSNMEIQDPLSYQHFSQNQSDILGPIRAFIVSFKYSLQNVTLAMSSPSCISSILVTLECIVNLKIIRLTTARQYPVEDIQCAILNGLTRFRRIPDLFFPGSTFSWDLFLGLGNLPILNLCFDSDIPRTFFPSSVYTPRVDALQFDLSPSRAAVNRSQRFKHLQSLALITTLDLIVDMHAILAPIESMKQLTLTTPMLDAPMADTQMYRRIAALFPSLTSFRWQVKSVHHLETPSWLDIPGLLAFKHLDNLSIIHPLPLALDDGAVARFLHAWPLMTHLNLNPCPRVHTWPSAPTTANGSANEQKAITRLTWEVLRGLIRRNGVLNALGLYLGAQEHACPPVYWEHSEVMDANFVLQHLLVGTNGPMHLDSRAALTAIFRGARVENSF